MSYSLNSLNNPCSSPLYTPSYNLPFRNLHYSSHHMNTPWDGAAIHIPSSKQSHNVLQVSITQMRPSTQQSGTGDEGDKNYDP